MFAFLGISSDSSPEQAKALQGLMTKAGFTTRAEIKTFIATGNLPAAATITAAVFQRGALMLALGVLLPGESRDNGADTGV